MRLIDADALFPYDGIQYFENDGLRTAYRIHEIIKNAPTIDAVPVVRCKDCIHWYDREKVCLKIYSDGNVNADAWQERKPDDFCSYGKRKDGDSNADNHD